MEDDSTEDVDDICKVDTVDHWSTCDVSLAAVEPDDVLLTFQRLSSTTNSE